MIVCYIGLYISSYMGCLVKSYCGFFQTEEVDTLWMYLLVNGRIHHSQIWRFPPFLKSLIAIILSILYTYTHSYEFFKFIQGTSFHKKKLRLYSNYIQMWESETHSQYLLHRACCQFCSNLTALCFFSVRYWVQ